MKILSSDRNLYWLIALMSMLVAGWIILQAGGVINHDGLLYVEAARLYDLGQWREGIKMYRWPFYPLLIALVHKLTGLDFQACAHLLAALFFVAASLGLAKLVRELGGERYTALFASLLLLASPYFAGDILPMVVRDHGGWALHLWSAVFLLRFMRTSLWRHALAWGACAIAAVLFRIEALTFLVLLPLILLLDAGRPLSTRARLFLKSHALLILAALLVLLRMGLTGSELQDMGRLHDPLRVLSRVYVQLTQGLADKAQLMGDHVLGSFLDDYALAGLTLTLAYILVIKAAGCAGWLQFGLALLSQKTKPLINNDGRLLLMWLLALGLLNGAMILLKGFLLPGRMLAPVAFVVIILAAFGLEQLRQLWLHKEAGWKIGAWAYPAVGIFLALQLLAVLWPGNAKNTYEIDAARWAVTEPPQNSRILYDTARLAYYAGHPLTAKPGKMDKHAQRILNSDEILAYDYAVLHASRKFPETRYTQRFGLPIATFEGTRDNKVLVYRIPGRKQR